MSFRTHGLKIGATAVDTAGGEGFQSCCCSAKFLFAVLQTAKREERAKGGRDRAKQAAPGRPGLLSLKEAVERARRGWCLLVSVEGGGKPCRLSLPDRMEEKI